MGLDREEVCVENSEGLIERLNNLRMLSPDARLCVDLARCHCYHSIYLFVPQCAPTLLPMFFCHFSCFFFFFLCCICTNVIYTSIAPKPFYGCQQPSTLWCVCVRGNSPICLCVMYINVALYDIYIKPEECWYINKIRAWFPQSFLVSRCSLLLKIPVTKDKHLAKKLSGSQALWPVRPASVTASPVCMTRPQAGVITLVPSTVRSGISMAQMDRRCTS